MTIAKLWVFQKMSPLGPNKQLQNSFESHDFILQDVVYAMFPFLFMDSFLSTSWLYWKFQSGLWELATEQEVTDGTGEVFPLTLGNSGDSSKSMRKCCIVGYK